MVSNPRPDYELSLLPANTRFLLGIDEVGRGPWAGPVTIGAFLIDLSLFDPSEFLQLKVRDSKQVPPLRRDKIYDYFLSRNFNFACFSASSSRIDQLGIAAAIEQLVGEALVNFQGSFDFALIDGNLNLPFPHHRSVVAADRDCYSVASASICAKVTRDRLMDDFDRLYPQYGFKDHKGYGTAAHLTALQKFGPCPIHRQSYKPIKNLKTDSASL